MNAARRRRASVVDLVAVPVIAFLAAKVTTLLVNVWWFPTLQRPSTEHTIAGSALLVPVRNEADRIADALPGLLAAGCQEVLILDDESTDDTRLVLDELLRQHPGASVRVLRGQPRPPGWVGKTWACAQLADASSAELLIFCDADVLLAPGAAVAVQAEMERQGAQAFSVFCRHRTGGWGERLLVPLIVDVLLCFLPFGLLRAPVPSAATAHGALFAFRRSAYTALGGFDAVRGELVEDVAMARLVRRSGLQLGLCLGGDIAQVRMYRTYQQVVSGFGRGLVTVAGGRRWLVLLGLGWHLLAYTVPVLAGRWSRPWLLAGVLGIVERLVLEAKTGGRDWAAAGLISLSPVAAVPVVLQSLRRRQSWRGRSYS